LNNPLLSIDWAQLIEYEVSIDVAYDKWFNKFIVNSFIPLKAVTIRPKDKPWMTGEICLGTGHKVKGEGGGGGGGGKSYIWCLHFW
jgi:hypothetical protein